MTQYALDLDEAGIGRFLVAARLAEQAEHDQWAEAGITMGATVADIGCGPEAITVLLANRVEPGGKVLGLDSNPAAVARARRLAGDSGPANVFFSVGDAASTGLTPRTFDVVMLRHVLGHNGRRQREIVDHLRSLVRPGGFLYLVDVDLTGVRMHPPDPSLLDMHRKYADFQVSRGNDVSAGLGLGDLITKAGLELTDLRGRLDIFHGAAIRGPAWEAREAMLSAGFARPEDLRHWREVFERLTRADDNPALFVPMFTATGRTPTTHDTVS